MRPQLLLFVAVCATLLLVFESSFILDPEVHQRAAAADAGGGKRAAALRVLFVVLFCSPLLLGVLLVQTLTLDGATQHRITGEKVVRLKWLQFGHAVSPNTKYLIS